MQAIFYTSGAWCGTYFLFLVEKLGSYTGASAYGITASTSTASTSISMMLNMKLAISRGGCMAFIAFC